MPKLQFLTAREPLEKLTVEDTCKVGSINTDCLPSIIENVFPKRRQINQR